MSKPDESLLAEPGQLLVVLGAAKSIAARRGQGPARFSVGLSRSLDRGCLAGQLRQPRGAEGDVVLRVKQEPVAVESE